MVDAPRRFFGPLIGLTLLFAAVGPPIGGAAFVPLAIFLKAPAAAGAVVFSAFLAALFGHWIMLIFAYLVGLGPATATGVIYALWDAAAPARWPRALTAAVIGGLVAYAVAERFAGLGAGFEMMFDPNFGAPTMQSISVTEAGPTTPVSVGRGLLHAFVLSGAVAGFVCAMAARLFGLAMRRTPLGPETVGAA